MNKQGASGEDVFVELLKRRKSDEEAKPLRDAVVGDRCCGSAVFFFTSPVCRALI